MTEKNPMKDIERFEFKYETKGCRIFLDNDPFIFINRRADNHLKVRSKRGNFYNALKEVGKEELFYSELITDIIKSLEINFVENREQKEVQKEEPIEVDITIDTWDKLKKVINKNLFQGIDIHKVRNKKLELIPDEFLLGINSEYKFEIFEAYETEKTAKTMKKFIEAINKREEKYSEYEVV